MIGALSPAEVKVFDLLAQGLTRAEIAEKLCRSPNTISTHIDRATKKLKARNPGHAVILFVLDRAEPK